MNPWLEVQDLIGDKDLWPYYVRDCLWRSELNYRSRVVIASFFYQNGVSIEFVLEVIKFCNKNWNNNKLIKISQLYNYWNDEWLGERRRSTYFAYDINLRRSLNLNGYQRVQGELLRHPDIDYQPPRDNPC